MVENVDEFEIDLPECVFFIGEEFVYRSTGVFPYSYPKRYALKIQNEGVCTKYRANIKIEVIKMRVYNCIPFEYIKMKKPIFHQLNQYRKRK